MGIFRVDATKRWGPKTQTPHAQGVAEDLKPVTKVCTASVKPSTKAKLLEAEVC